VPALEKAVSPPTNRFRDLVTRYMRKFDTLLVQSGKGRSRGHALRATFLTADVGKLYLIIDPHARQAWEKLN